MTAKSFFKIENTFEKRLLQSNEIREKYPDRVPVIVERAQRSRIRDIDKNKFLVPADITIGQFVCIIRKRLKVTAETAIFVFINNILPPTSEMLGSIYEKNKEEDGYLYVTYSGENTFGFH
ncbi:autophagy-related protein 8C-like [Senna tora]|uniref:Autophagy-related protein n=1 Tax=Senna tora TaxID=362788 RepID=A0A834SZY7_9FABA|nr:autophagy-related protein 8C-like [Senna tora]